MSLPTDSKDFPPYLDYPLKQQDNSNVEISSITQEFNLGDEVTAQGSSTIRIIRTILKDDKGGELSYKLDNGCTYKAKDLRIVKKPYPNKANFLIGDKVECGYGGMWTDGEVIGFDQDVYLYVKTKEEPYKHCHFSDIRLMQPRKPDLAGLLEKHIGRHFYSPLLGIVKLKSIDEALHFQYGGIEFITARDGTDSDGNMAIFPSQKNRDWEEWRRLNKPSTWEEVMECSDTVLKVTDEYKQIVSALNNDWSEKAAAFAKLIFLCKYCYGEDLTKEANVKRFLSHEDNRKLLTRILS